MLRLEQRDDQERLVVEPATSMQGSLRVPGDKSISHRAVMLAAVARGESLIKGFLPAEDTLNTLGAIKSLGVKVEKGAEGYLIRGRGGDYFEEPRDVMEMGNSGTGMRLLTGMLSAQGDGYFVLTGDASLRQRPMKRIIGPLSRMGGRILGRCNHSLPPLTVLGSELEPINYRLPIPSAQVKSSILLAALFTEGTTTIKQPLPSRDHTERMLSYLGAQIDCQENEIRLQGPASLQGAIIDIPGDLSSAAFLLVAGMLLPESRLELREVGINPTRSGLLEILQRMGASLTLRESRELSGEPRGELAVSSSSLRGIELGEEVIPRLIDEIPVLVAAAVLARGQTVIRGAKELRVKETDRIKALVTEFGRMGASIQELEDGMIIEGQEELPGGVTCESYGDHRIAMALAVAGLASRRGVTIRNWECTHTSFPGFVELLNNTIN